ncbi:MAG: XTP/dITP diphosphatase [Deltaproteobacteria bacterium]|nr:XTP/dITP diphosphatase [Deltaproteobacteria bacterium]
MEPQLTIVLATTNQGKLSEIKRLLSNQPVQFKSLADFGPIPKAVEDGDTFDENAYKKASHTARVLGFPALADDSGLVVDALGGEPGVHSARYGGPGLSDAQRTELLLQNMEGVPNRSAHFACVISLAVPTGPALTWEAEVHGEIAHAPAGESGFGYDPVFYYPPAGKTFAQMTAEEKNAVSHRGKALAEMASEWDKVMVWLKMHL